MKNNIKNKLPDLTDHLFAQIERLGDEDLKGDALREEIERAKAVTGVASQIIGAGTLALKAVIAKDNMMNADLKAPRMLLDE